MNFRSLLTLGLFASVLGAATLPAHTARPPEHAAVDRRCQGRVVGARATGRSGGPVA